MKVKDVIGLQKRTIPLTILAFQGQTDPHQIFGGAPAGHAQLFTQGSHPAVRRLHKSVEFLEAPFGGDPDEDIQELGSQAPPSEVIVNDDREFSPTAVRVDRETSDADEAFFLVFLRISATMAISRS